MFFAMGQLHAQSDTVIVYDTVRVVKYIKIYDTVYYIAKQKVRKASPLVPNKSLPTLRKVRDLRYKPAKPVFNFQTQFDLEYDLFHKEIQSEAANLMLLGQYESGRWLMGSGLALRHECFHQRFNRNFIQVDSSFTFEVETFDQMNIDTIAFVDISNWPDTSIVYVYDTTYQTITDSTVVWDYDTTDNRVRRDTQFSVRFVGVPLFIGYQFLFRNFTFVPFGGLVIYLPVYAKGHYTDNRGMLRDFNRNKLQYTFIQFNAGLDIRINWNRHWSSSIVGGLRWNINNVLKTFDNSELSNVSVFSGVKIGYNF